VSFIAIYSVFTRRLKVLSYFPLVIIDLTLRFLGIVFRKVKIALFFENPWQKLSAKKHPCKLLQGCFFCLKMSLTAVVGVSPTTR